MGARSADRKIGVPLQFEEDGALLLWELWGDVYGAEHW